MPVGLLSFAALRYAFSGGRSQIGLSPWGTGGSPSINQLTCGGRWGWVNTTGVDALTPDLFDDNGYPVASAKFTSHGGVKRLVPIDSDLNGVADWVLEWDGGGTVTLGPGGGGGSVTTVSGSGTSSPWRFTLTTTTDLTVGITAVGPTNMRLYNLSEKSRLDAGQYFSAKLLERLRQAKFSTLRFLDWQAGNSTNATNWDNGNKPLDYYNLILSQFRRDALCNYAGSGMTTNSGGDYSVSAPSNWSGLVHGALVHAVWNANSPTSASVSFAGGGSPNITWAAHGLADGNQIYFTNSGGAVPTEISASTLNVLPSIYYFVTVIDSNTINVSATDGGSVINFSTTGTGTTTGRTNVTLDVGGTGKVQVLTDGFQQLTSGGNAFPVGNGGDTSLSTLTYDATLNAWGKQGGTTGSGGINNGVPISLCVRLCKEVGAHPWFISPPLVCAPMSDYHTELAILCRDTAPSWMIPIFEGPNETWNNAGGFTQTNYANSIAQIYGWGSDYNNWYGKITSTIGQAVAAVYGVAKANVKSQTKYRVICGVQTSVCSSPASAINGNAARLSATKYVNNVGGMQSPPQSGYALDPASDWVTDVCCSNYFAPSWYGRNQEVRLAFSYYVTNAGNPTAQEADATTYVGTCDSGEVCTFTNGSPGLINLPGNGFAAGQIFNLATDGTINTGASAGTNYWVATPGDSFTFSSTDPNNGGTTLVNLSGSATGTTYCVPNGVATLSHEYIYAKNVAAFGATYGVDHLRFYEGGYSPDFNNASVTSPISGATQTNPCVVTLLTTSVQGIRNPVQQNSTNPAAVVGMYLQFASVGGMTQLNGNRYQITKVGVADGLSAGQVEINVDATGFSAYTSGGSVTYQSDAGGTSMAVALNALRKAGKNVSLLETTLMSLYDLLMTISGASEPSCYIMSGDITAVPLVWAVLSPNFYVTPDPPQWNAIVGFNA